VTNEGWLDGGNLSLRDFLSFELSLDFLNKRVAELFLLAGLAFELRAHGERRSMSVGNKINGSCNTNVT